MCYLLCCSSAVFKIFFDVKDKVYFAKTQNEESPSIAFHSKENVKFCKYGLSLSLNVLE